MDHFPSSKPVEKASSNSNCGLNQQTIEADGVLLFDEVQSIPIEVSSHGHHIISDNALNQTIDLTNDMINDETKTNDSFHDDFLNNDNNDLYFASVISNSSSLKLNDYVQREKEGLNQVQKVKPSFNKKKLFELANSMDYLSHCSENYFPQSIVRKKREQKKMEKENMSKDS